jgi:ubiquinone/menaquinone biosynthesis C-methylase UbiE
MAAKNIFVVGIDLSDVAIMKSEEYAKEKELSELTEFHVMNAEEISFTESEFNGVLGVSILHHLELKKILNKLAQILDKNGKGIFLEPLGHNPFINLYRKLTPNYRTEDEHPFTRDDIELLNKYFENIEVKYFHLTTLLAVPFRRTAFFGVLLSVFSKMDSFLFKINPLKYWAWQVVISVSNPIKQ